MDFHSSYCVYNLPIVLNPEFNLRQIYSSRLQKVLQLQEESVSLISFSNYWAIHYFKRDVKRKLPLAQNFRSPIELIFHYSQEYFNGRILPSKRLSITINLHWTTFCLQGARLFCEKLCHIYLFLSFVIFSCTTGTNLCVTKRVSSPNKGICVWFEK